MDQQYHISPPSVPPNLVDPGSVISTTGNHGLDSLPAAYRNAQYPPTLHSTAPMWAHPPMFEPTNSLVNTYISLVGRPSAPTSRPVPGPTSYTAPPSPHQPRTAHHVPRPPPTRDKSRRTRTACHPYPTVSYRKTHRPPATYSPDITVVAESCRADGGEESSIALLSEIFANGISEKALTRKLTRDEARTYNGRAPTQIYRMLLRRDEAGRSHCRLCAVNANENGWKNPRDVLRHLKRDHFGLGYDCTSCGYSAYTAGEMSRHRCEALASSVLEPSMK